MGLALGDIGLGCLGYFITLFCGWNYIFEYAMVRKGLIVGR